MAEWGRQTPFGRIAEWDGFPDNAFDMIPMLFRPVQRGAAASGPRTDVYETETAYQLEVELPGVRKEDIQVNVHENTVSVEGEAREEREAGKERNWLLRERTIGKFSRSLQLPEAVDDTKCVAKFEGGVLVLSLPKKRATATRRLNID